MYQPNPPAQDRRAINAPRVVVVLIAIFAAVHFVLAVLPTRQATWIFLAGAFIPARYADTAFYPPELIPGGVGADYWSFVTHLFLHGDLTHLVVNSLWMLAFGTVVARRLTAPRFLFLSALCGIAGALAHLAIYWGELVPVIGASAAISGQMGAATRFIFAEPGGLFRVARMNPSQVRVLGVMETFRTPQALVFIAVWLGINLFVGASGMALLGEGQRIAWEAHIAGFFAGLLAFGAFNGRGDFPADQNPLHWPKR